MKLSKFMWTAIAALGFCGLPAQAQSAFVGVTTNYSTVNVSITVTTNRAEKDTGTLRQISTSSVNLGNKQLLDLFASWNGIIRTNDVNWKNARIVIGWDGSWNYDVLVVDKTGTNVLFDATAGVSGAYFQLQLFNASGAYTYSDRDADPGFEQWNQNYTAYVNLYDDFVSGNYIDIQGTGGNIQNFHQNWNANDVGTTWTDTENVTIPNEGGQTFQAIDLPTSVRIQVTASGHGAGYNYIND